MIRKEYVVEWPHNDYILCVKVNRMHGLSKRQVHQWRVTFLGAIFLASFVFFGSKAISLWGPFLSHWVYQHLPADIGLKIHRFVVRFIKPLLSGSVTSTWTTLLALVLYFWKLKNVWTWVCERIWPFLDLDLLIPIPRAKPMDPLFGSGLGEEIDNQEFVLPWDIPTSGTRADAWRELYRFVLTGAGDGSGNLFWKPKDLKFSPFKFVTLCGWSGTGKTRMALEFLRNEMGQLDHLEGENKLPWRTRLGLRTGAWWRRVWHWSERRDPDRENPDGLSDPWDVGWLKPPMDKSSAGLHETYEHRGNLHGDYLDKLRRWSPRKPTALLLDDPLRADERFDDVSKVIDALEAGMKDYRYPVRLVIVNQAGVTREAETSLGTQYPTIRFEGDARLDDKEVERLAVAYKNRPRGPDEARSPAAPDLDLKLFFQITSGNAMLIELAFHALYHGGTLNGLDAPALIELRARRVLKSLVYRYPSKFNMEAQLTLAKTTLAGRSSGQLRPEPDQVVTEKQREALRKLQNELDKLRDCFNLADTARIPAVRPDRVGDDFVRLVLHAHCVREDTPANIVPAEEVISDAWRISPYGVLQTVRRVAVQGDLLGNTICAGPPEDVKLSVLELAEAYTEAIVLHRLEQPRLLDSAWMASSCVNRYVGLLSVAEATTYLKNLILIAVQVPGLQWVRTPKVLECALASLGWTQRQKTWRQDADTKAEGTGELERVRFREYINELHQILFQSPAKYRFFELSLTNLAPFLGLVKEFSLPETFGSLTDSDVLICMQAWVIGATLSANGYLETECLSCKEGVLTMAAERQNALNTASPLLREFDLERTRVWAGVCYLYKISDKQAECEAAKEEVLKIAEANPYLGDREFDLERIRVWRAVCQLRAKSVNEAECEQAKKRVLEIAEIEPYLGDRSFDLERAAAWCNVCFLYMELASEAKCKAAKKEVLKIAEANPYLGDREFDLERTEVWRAVCQLRAKSVNEAECEQAKKRVLEIAEIEPYPGDPSFDLERAAAWCNVCFLYMELASEAKCNAAKKEVLKIAEANPYLGDQDFDRGRAIAWRYICSLYAGLANEAECEAGRTRC